MITANDIKVPLDVLPENRDTYIHNFLKTTSNTGRLMLFAGDQKVEHLNEDFYGEGIAPEDNDPIHLFNIASKANIGAFATQVGLIARYGMDFPDIPYIVKLNSKTSLVKTAQAEPRSDAWFNIKSLMEFKKSSNLNILGIGYTIYLGSENESAMLQEASRLIFTAHQEGLITILWIYPRGEAVKEEKDPDLIAGATGVASCLGTDFVKVNPPKQEGAKSAELLQRAVQSAGRTKVICAGGSSMDTRTFLQTLHDQIHIGGAQGNATGRNIHQRPLDEAIKFCNAIHAITVEDKSVEEALKISIINTEQNI
ncbi:MAG: aldolase [Candidatus Roizmanbacteria bacterium]